MFTIVTTKVSYKGPANGVKLVLDSRITLYLSKVFMSPFFGLLFRKDFRKVNSEVLLHRNTSTLDGGKCFRKIWF
jgi:hypothetical protein